MVAVPVKLTSLAGRGAVPRARVTRVSAAAPHKPDTAFDRAEQERLKHVDAFQELKNMNKKQSVNRPQKVQLRVLALTCLLFRKRSRKVPLSAQHEPHRCARVILRHLIVKKDLMACAGCWCYSPPRMVARAVSCSAAQHVASSHGDTSCRMPSLELE